VVVAVRSVRGGGRPPAVETPLPSKLFGPSHLLATPLEKEVQKQWDALPDSAARSAGTSAH
jgi:carbon starvation protein